MKLVYVSHPYGGKKENEVSVKAYIDELYKHYPGIAFVSPIGGINCPYGDIAYHEGLAYCLRLLEGCDEILALGDWENSTGVKAELAFAYYRGKRITYAEDYPLILRRK